MAAVNTTIAPLHQKAICTFAVDQSWSAADLGNYVRAVVTNGAMTTQPSATQPSAAASQTRGASRRTRQTAKQGRTRTPATQIKPMTEFESQVLALIPSQGIAQTGLTIQGKDGRTIGRSLAGLTRKGYLVQKNGLWYRTALQAEPLRKTG